MPTVPAGDAHTLARLLGPLGVDSRSEDVYRRVLAAPGRSVAELAAALGWSPGAVRRQLRQLTALQLVRVSAGAVHAEPPELALRDLLQAESARLVDAQTALSQARLAVPDLVAEFRASSPAAAEEHGLQTLAGVEGIRTLADLCLRTDGPLAFLRADQWLGDTSAAVDELVVEQVGAGRASRAIYPVHVLDDVPDRVRARAEAGEQVRVLPELTARLAIFGTTAAVTTELWERPTGNRLAVRQPGLVRALQAYFDALWARAVVPPELATDGSLGIDDDRRQLLVLMREGAIDQQIARASGVSVRTVRRRIAAVMAELGASSRFGAGVEAARRGWI